MGHNNREIEIKLKVNASSSAGSSLFTDVCQGVRDVLGSKVIQETRATSDDIYWHPPFEDRADFARLRQFPDGSGEMTVKFSDKGSNLNRIEIDCPVKDFLQAKEFLAQLLGEPTGVLRKEYIVFFFDRPDEEGISQNASVYQIIQKNKRLDVFVEIEGLTEGFVEKISTKLQQGLGHELERMADSLYTMFIRKAALEAAPKKLTPPRKAIAKNQASG